MITPWAELFQGRFEHIPAMSTCLASASYDCTTRAHVARLFVTRSPHTQALIILWPPQWPARQGIRIAKLVPQRDRVLRCSSIRILVSLNGEHTVRICYVK